MKRIPLINGDEQDAFSKHRKYHHWKRGLIKLIKRAYRKRFRQKEKNYGTDNE